MAKKKKRKKRRKIWAETRFLFISPLSHTSTSLHLNFLPFCGGDHCAETALILIYCVFGRWVKMRVVRETMTKESLWGLWEEPFSTSVGYLSLVRNVALSPSSFEYLVPIWFFNSQLALKKKIIKLTIICVIRSSQISKVALPNWGFCTNQAMFYWSCGEDERQLKSASMRGNNFFSLIPWTVIGGLSRTTRSEVPIFVHLTVR